jgi:hypothetical protein
MSCWYACAEMLFKYRRPNADFREYLAASGTAGAMLSRYDSGLSIETDGKSLEGNLERWADLTDAFGMRELRPIPGTLPSLAAAIQDYGPLWCAGTFFQGSESGIGHIVVLTGVITRSTQFGRKGYVVFHDPAPLKFNGEANCLKQWDVWFNKRLYNEHVTNGESPVMHFPESAVSTSRAPQVYAGLGVGRREEVRRL